MSEHADKPPGTRLDPEPGRVLLIDDEPVVLATIQRMMDALGREVLLAETAADALTQLEAHAENIGVAILDLALPDQPGTALIGELRRRWPDLRVIVHTGADPSGVRQQLLDAGAIAVLQKPYTIAQLREALAAALGPA